MATILRREISKNAETMIIAYMEAIERALDAPPKLLFRLDAETVKEGFAINAEITTSGNDIR